LSRLRCGFIFGRRHLIWIDADHEVADVVVDLGKPVACSSGDDDDIARFQLEGLSVADGSAVASWTIR
jgi:imidazoleglycerol phosphate dehydratase HisB